MALRRHGATDRPGFVFCVRIGDWDRPLFRYVELGDDSDPVVIDDTLACLDQARPPDGFDTPRSLDDETYQLAFDAWELGRDDIIENWNWHADKANLEPKIPKVLARAAEIVRSTRRQHSIKLRSMTSSTRSKRRTRSGRSEQSAPPFAQLTIRRNRRTSYSE